MKPECELEKKRTSIINELINKNPDLYSKLKQIAAGCNTQQPYYEVKVVFSGTEEYEWQTEQK